MPAEMAFFNKTKRMKVPGSFGLAVLMIGTSLLPAQSVDWQVKGANFESKTLPVGVPLQISVNGSTLSLQPDRGEGDAAAKASSSTLMYKFARDKWELVREVKLDGKRNALRVLDTFSNNSEEDINLRVDYNTALTRGRNVRFNGTISDNGEYREQGNGIADNTIGVIAMAESQNSEAVPLFIWGQQSAPWPFNINDVNSYLRFGYQGSIPANGKASLVHWVATAGIDKNVKLEQTFDLFWKEQKLVNPLLTPDQLAAVVNFLPEALQGGSSEQTVEHQPLVLLDALCDRLGLSRGDKAILSMGTNGSLEGQLTLGDLTLSTPSGEVVSLKGDQIAALRGGAGLGRLNRVFLRDGSVLVGKATLKDATFNAGSGSIGLEAAALDLIVAARQKEDGKKPDNARYSVTLLDGESLWLEEVQAGELSLAASFGKVQVPTAAIVEWKRQDEPPFQYELTLEDGSRIQGVFLDREVTLQLASGRNIKVPMVKISSLAMINNPDTKPHGLATCELRDGTILKGQWQPAAMKLHLGISEVPFKSEEVIRLSRGNAGSFEVELTNGSKFSGQLADASIVWNMSGKPTTLPVALVASIQQPADKSAEEKKSTPAPSEEQP